MCWCFIDYWIEECTVKHWNLIYSFKFVNLFPTKICQNYFREETDADQRNRCLLHSDPHTTHTVGRNGCRGFFCVFLAATNRSTLNVEVVNTAGETEIWACEMQRVITVQLLYWLRTACVTVCLIVNKTIYNFSFICNNMPSTFFAVLLTNHFRTTGLKQHAPEFAVHLETAVLFS